MANILFLRFSAIGDVLMTVPVIDSFARQHPDMRIIVCSRGWARPIFGLLPRNVMFVEADLKGRHHGLRGLNRLYRRLLALHPAAVADLHDVLRTQWLRLRFRGAGLKVYAIRKDRRARRRFLTQTPKTLQLSVFEKYADVVRRAGYPDFSITFSSLFPPAGADLTLHAPTFDAALRPERNWVAVAPFATYEGKTYPPDLMEQVVAALARRGDVRVLLLGAGASERALLEQWAASYGHVESLAGKLGNMAAEAAVLSHCKVMVAMDSANMHLASLVALPVVSIWGATHPYSGFMGYGQRQADAVQLTDLPCRPCSIYGNKPCALGGYPCLRGIDPHYVLERIEHYLA